MNSSRKRSAAQLRADAMTNGRDVLCEKRLLGHKLLSISLVDPKHHFSDGEKPDCTCFAKIKRNINNRCSKCDAITALVGFSEPSFNLRAGKISIQVGFHGGISHQSGWNGSGIKDCQNRISCQSRLRKRYL